MTKNIIIGALAVVVIVLGVNYLFAGTLLGAAGSGPNHTQAENFLQGLFAGVRGQFHLDNSGSLTNSATTTLTGYTYVKSPVLSTGITTLTATATTTTLTAAQICAGGGVINWAPPHNSTATLPTTASLVAACLPSAGDSIVVRFRNTTATGTYNLVAGTGQTLFHVMEVASTTSQGTTITSSTPITARFWITLASSTDSTASVDLVKMLTP